ncbi:MAG: aquaporin [Actinomycetes bacterium]
MSDVTNPVPLGRRVFAEGLGTGALVTVVIGSGAMAARLSDDVGAQLLINAVATGAALYVLIAQLAPISGAQFNPLVTGVDAAFGGRHARSVGLYVAAQVVGAVLGAMLANLMFGLPAVNLATIDRVTSATMLGEVVATFGLTAVVFGLARSGRAPLVAPSVALYITSAYFFTSSTSFANPAVTIGRMFSDTFAGIAPGSVVPFFAAQAVGAAIGYGVVRVLWPQSQTDAPENVVMEEQA